MSRHTSVCPQCGFLIDWIDNPPKVLVIENSTPNISPSSSEPLEMECPNCKLWFETRTGKEVSPQDYMKNDSKAERLALEQGEFGAVVAKELQTLHKAWWQVAQLVFPRLRDEQNARKVVEGGE